MVDLFQESFPKVNEHIISMKKVNTACIRYIRSSEKLFWRKVLDIYVTKILDLLGELYGGRNHEIPDIGRRH